MWEINGLFGLGKLNKKTFQKVLDKDYFRYIIILSHGKGGA
jgi:hypothetical protein